MKHINKLLKNKAIFAALLALSVCVLAFSGVQSSRAALTYFSEYYTAQMTVSDIGITLVENGRDVSWRNYVGSSDRWFEDGGELLTNMLREGESLQLGRAYPEELTVINTGKIDEYVRVVVKKYWELDGEKNTDLTPDLIDLHFLTDGNWIVDESASTEEQTVLYYAAPLPVGAQTDPFTDTLRIDSSIGRYVTDTVTIDGGYKTITSTFDYDGIRFVIEAEADGVQTHNAADAIKSAWGINANIDENGNLSLG